MKQIGIAISCWIAFAASLLAQLDRIATRFKQIDADNDGKLSAAELKGVPAIQVPFERRGRERGWPS